MKKALVLLLSVTLATGCLVGCSGDPGPGTASNVQAESDATADASSTGEAGSGLAGDYTVWVWDMALQSLEESAKLFAEANPDAAFNFELISSEQIYDKMTPVLASGTGLPDIVALEGEQFARFATKFPDRFADFSGLVNQDDFLPNKVAEVMVGGKMLGLPWDAAPVALFYRQDIMDEAGVNMEEVETYDDLIAAGVKVKEATGMAMLPMATSRNDNIYRYALMQQGAFYFDSDGNPMLDSPESIAAMDTVKKLYDAGVTVNHNDWSEYISTFTQGKAACVAEAVWMLGSMKADGADQSGQWRVRSLPSINGSKGVASNGGAAIAVTSAQEDMAAAVEFVKFAMTDPACLVNGFVNWGLYPSYIPVYSDPVFSEPDEYCGGQLIYETFNKMATEIPPVSYTQNFGEAKDIMKNAIAQVCIEGKSPEETMRAIQEELKNKLSA